jgi:hypothetical protein
MNRVAANRPAHRSSSSEEITVEPDGLQTVIADVGRVVTSTDDEQRSQSGLRSGYPICWPAATGFRWRSRARRPCTT